MIRAILFGFSGILVDDEPLRRAAVERVLAEEGIELGAGDYDRACLGLDDRSCLEAVLRQAGEPATVQRLMRLAARKSAYYQERLRTGGYPFVPGAAELAADLAAGGRMLGVVSGALREEVEGALRQAGLRELFKVVVTAEDVAEGKPDPEGYRRALEGLNSLPPLPERLLHPHEVLAVEAGPAGLAAAADAGFRTLGVAHTRPAGRLPAAEAVVESLAGLSVERLERLLAEAGRR